MNFDYVSAWVSLREHNSNRLRDLQDDYGSRNSFLVGFDRRGEPLFSDFGTMGRSLGLMVGAQNVGKSIYLARLAEYFNLVYGCPVIIFDPADEYGRHANPLSDEKTLPLLGKLGLKPMGFGDRLVRVRPLGLEGDADAHFNLSLNDLREFGTETYELLLSSALDVDLTSPAQSSAVSWLCQQEQCQTLAELLVQWNTYKHSLKEEGETQSAGHMTKRFYQARTFKLFGKNSYDFKKALNERKIICLLGNPGAGRGASKVYSFYASYLALAVYYWGLKREIPPVLVLRDELAGFVKYPEGMQVVEREYNFMRKAFNHGWQATQFPNMIPRELLLQMMGTAPLLLPKIPPAFVELVQECKWCENLDTVVSGLDSGMVPPEMALVDGRGVRVVGQMLPTLSDYHRKRE